MHLHWRAQRDRSFTELILVRQGAESRAGVLSRFRFMDDVALLRIIEVLSSKNLNLITTGSATWVPCQDNTVSLKLSMTLGILWTNRLVAHASKHTNH